MKSYYIQLFLLLTISTVFGQDKYLTKTGITSFEASVPSFEEVKAKNESTTVILNSQNGDIAALILVKGFRFKNALMEEHFNENYAESDQFPKATFKGTITNFKVQSLTDVKTPFTFNGSLNFHGITKEITNEKIDISSSNDALHLSGNFYVDVSDFDIEIPKIVSNKLSKKVKVSFNYTLKKK